MTAYVKYRVTDAQTPWNETTVVPQVKGEPLSNQEIDRNWTSVVAELEKKANIDGQTLTGTVLVNSTTALGIPAGNTSQRPLSPLVRGMIRFNTDNSTVEYYSGTGWQAIGKVAQGGEDDEIFFLNDTIITENYTIPTGKNAMSAGPLRIAAGVTITVPSGSTWTIVGDDSPSLYRTYVGPTTIVGE